MSEIDQDETDQVMDETPAEAVSEDASVSQERQDLGNADGEQQLSPEQDNNPVGAVENPALDNNAQNSSDDVSAENPNSSAAVNPDDSGDDDFEPLTDTYEALRHSTDSEELSRFARESLPPRSEQAAFSRATALLEAVAGNQHTPLEDRLFLAETMPFPNVLVKLSEDENDDVRQVVASNADDKNWLVGRLAKDKVRKVREAALRNPQASWKIRIEGAQDAKTTADTLDFLSELGVESEPDAPAILSAMVRRAVALNPNCSQATLDRLAKDTSIEVQHAVASRLG